MIGFFEYQYLKFKKKHLANLVEMAKIDGRLDKEEVKLLFKIGKKFKLKPWQIRAIIDSESSGEIFVPEDIDEKLSHLYDMVEMMMADGIIDEREIQLCRAMVKKFGFSNKIISVMINYYRSGGEAFKEWESFREELKSMGV